MTQSQTEVPEQLDLIDGELRPPGGAPGAWLADPNTGAGLTRAASTAAPAVEAAIACASRVHEDGGWYALPADQRAAALRRVADELRAMVDDVAVAECLGSGVPLSITRLFAGSLPDTFEAAARYVEADRTRDLSEGDRVVELHRFPWGPAAVLVPWNAPAAMAAKKSAYALAAGCPVIVKPPEAAPLSAQYLATAIQRAELPPGAFQMVHGGPEVGVALTTDARVAAVSFTGSAATGRAVAVGAAASLKAVQLELGGNNPVVVLPDADLEQAAEALAAGMVKLNGQWCEGPGKVFVPDAIHDELLDALAARLRSYRIGDTWSATTDIGPLANQRHRDQLDAQVSAIEAAGGRVHVCGSAPTTAGWFWAPRFVTDAPQAACVDELFGPVVTVHRVPSEEAAISMANDSPYGLAAYVFAGDLGRGFATAHALRFGEVKVNGTSILDMSDESAQSFWRGSGIGGHGNRELFEFFRGTQIVGMDQASLPL